MPAARRRPAPIGVNSATLDGHFQFFADAIDDFVTAT
jgi:hypothetical protein